MKGVKIIAGIMVAVVLVAAAGTAVMAASPTPVPGTAIYCQGGGLRGYGVGGDCLEVVSALTGLTEAEIEAQRDTGKSLVEIAATKGVTEDALVAAIVADRKADLQKLVTAGTITQERVDLMLGQMESRIKSMVNNTAAGGCGNGNGCGSSAQGAGPGLARQLGRGSGCGMGGGGVRQSSGNMNRFATK